MTISSQYRIFKFKIFILFFLSNITLSSLNNIALAQITVDDSLGVDKSEVLPVNAQIDLIQGGATRGSNLFHSFGEFNIGEGREANFANPVDIKNIFSRVTGSNPSRLLGKLGVLGDANLFFINPNGIIFGENASLNINGSFVGSTASGIVFSESNLFSATNPQAPPLLTINVPLGLQFAGVPGKIINRSVVEDNGELIGLGVKPGKTLALVGGDVDIEGGFLRAEAGRVELGSVTGNNTVSLTSTDAGFVLDYAGIENFGDISLSQAAYVDTSGKKGGDVQIQARQITLTEGSQIYLNSFDEGKVGDLTVKASELVKLEGTGTSEDEFGEFQFPSGFFGDVTDKGDGGTISIETKRLIVENGGGISTSTFGEGKGGNLNIKASESVEVLGTAPDGEFPSLLFADVFDAGDGGNLKIETQRLIIKDGAQVKASTFGDANAGNLTVKASQSLELEGVLALTNTPSGLFSQVNKEATGNAGKLTIETGKLTIRDGAQIASSTIGNSQGGDLNINASDSILVSGTSPNATLVSGQSGIFVSAEPSYTDDLGELIPTTGNSGNLTINTGKLTVEDGGKISADTFGTGKAGELNLNVNQLIVRNGGLIRTGSLVEDGAVSRERGNGGILTVNATESVTITGTGTIGDTKVNSTLFTAAEGTGNAGNLFITTPSLLVKDSGEVTVSSTGTGNAGNLEITADKIELNNQAKLVGETVATADAGNITLNLEDFLLLRNQSQVSTSAGTAAAPGNGGNITVNAPDGFIVAVPNENSDITANAFSGEGGQITIDANNIFGIAPLTRDELIQQLGTDNPEELNPNNLPSSNITAISQQNPNLNGDFTITDPVIDPNRGLIELPSNLVDASQQVAQACTPRGRQNASTFIATGRGGLPLSPNQPLRKPAVITSWVDLPSQDVSEGVGNREYRVVRKRIVEAQKIVTDKNGDIFFVAESEQGGMGNSGLSCG
jgi:filamentous hemagglutinin family protein